MGMAAISTQRFNATELAAINRELAEGSAEAVVRWALGTGLRPFLSTSFGPQAAVMLDIVSGVDPSVPVVWIDTGYNLRDTYEVAETKVAQVIDTARRHQHPLQCTMEKD